MLFAACWPQRSIYPWVGYRRFVAPKNRPWVGSFQVARGGKGRGLRKLWIYGISVFGPVFEGRLARRSLSTVRIGHRRCFCFVGRSMACTSFVTISLGSGGTADVIFLFGFRHTICGGRRRDKPPPCAGPGATCFGCTGPRDAKGEGVRGRFRIRAAVAKSFRFVSDFETGRRDSKCDRGRILGIFVPGLAGGGGTGPWSRGSS